MGSHLLLNSGEEEVPPHGGDAAHVAGAPVSVITAGDSELRQLSSTISLDIVYDRHVPLTRSAA
jgi:hypothetical protein